MYRNYKKFDINQFNDQLYLNLRHSCENYNFSVFNNIFLNLLNVSAPYKEDIVRGNHKPSINKKIRKEMMQRSHLKNITNKTGCEHDLQAYKHHRNVVVSLIKKDNKTFFADIEIRTDVKGFWEACKPYMASKPIHNKQRISLVENGILLPRI